MSDRKVDLTERQWKMQLHAAHLAGASRERAAIVAWLRDEETWRRVARGNLAVFIERGEHLRGDDE